MRTPLQTLLAPLLLVGLLAAPAAYAQDSLTVGVYAPRIFFGNSLARGQYAQQVAQALAAKTGLDIKGRAYVGGGEFGAQIKAGEVHFAVVDAQYAIDRGYAPIAQGTAGGNTAPPMALVVGGGVDAKTVGDLQGKRLVRVAVSGSDQKFQLNWLLQGQVGPDYFKAGGTARDAQGAISLVKLGKADAAFTYSSADGGLRSVYRSRGAPLPYFVQTNDDVPADVAAKVRAAIRGVQAKNPVFDGFGPPGNNAGLAGALKRGLTRPSGAPILTSVKNSMPPVPTFLEAGDATPVLPSPTAELPAPELPKDLF